MPEEPNKLSKSTFAPKNRRDYLQSDDRVQIKEKKPKAAPATPGKKPLRQRSNS
jgi:hypothetical protein